MALGPDIKEVLQEVGAKVIIYRSPTNITGEFVKIKVNAQVTKPFIREFFSEATLAYDTKIVPGDVIELVDDARKFIVMNKTPINFEGAAYQFSAVLYKSNVTGIIYRPSITKQNYKSEMSWVAVQDPCYALLTENQYGNELAEDGEFGQAALKVVDCYVSHSADIGIGDQFQVSLDEYYRVESISKRRFDSVDLVTLGEDNRGAASV